MAVRFSEDVSITTGFDASAGGSVVSGRYRAERGPVGGDGPQAVERGERSAKPSPEATGLPLHAR